MSKLYQTKILHLIIGTNPESGGVSQAMRSIISGLRFLNVESEVVCLDDPKASFLMKDNFQIFALGIGDTQWRYNKNLPNWLALNANNYTAIIVHGLWQYHTYAIRSLYKNRDRLPKVYLMPHGMLDPWFQKSKGRKIKAIRNWLLWHLSEKKIVNLCDGLFFTCETEKVLARQTFSFYNPKKEIVVGLGITPPPVFSSSMTSAFSSKIKSKKRYILFLGRIDVKKGVDLLIKSYLEIKKTLTELPLLVIAGPGTESKFGLQMQELANKDADIIFPGMINNDVKWGAFYGCDAFILPSHQENFGIAVVEALACSKPVLISNQVNIWKEIETENAGFIAPDTMEGTKQLLISFINLDNDNRLEMGKRARETYQKYFTVESASKKIFQEL